MSGSPLRPHLLDLGERVLVTAAESAAALYLANGHISVSAGEAAMLSGVAAGLAGLRAWLVRPATGPASWVEDLVARAAFTFGQTLVAALVTAASTALTMSSVKAAAVAGLASAVAVVKGAVAQHFGDPASAGFVTPTRRAAVPPPVARSLTQPASATIPLQRSEQDIAAAVVTELANRLRVVAVDVGPEPVLPDRSPAPTVR